MKYIFFILCFISLPLLAQRNASYIIYSGSDDLIILNKYEQVTHQDFLPGTPLQIIASDHLLSDGISVAYKCLLDKDIYFIRHGQVEPDILKRCTVLEDTIRMVGPGATLHYTDGSAGTLKANQVIKRIFSKSGRTYIFDGKYAWSRLNRKNWEKPQEKPDLTIQIPNILLAQITSRVAAINKNYREFYSFFNARFKKSFSTPIWNLQHQDEQLILYLNQQETLSSISLSTAVFVNDLELLLQGSAFHCFPSENHIIISSGSER